MTVSFTLPSLHLATHLLRFAVNRELLAILLEHAIVNGCISAEVRFEVQFPRSCQIDRSCGVNRETWDEEHHQQQ